MYVARSLVWLSRTGQPAARLSGTFDGKPASAVAPRGPDQHREVRRAQFSENPVARHPAQKDELVAEVRHRLVVQVGHGGGLLLGHSGYCQPHPSTIRLRQPTDALQHAREMVLGPRGAGVQQPQTALQ